MLIKLKYHELQFSLLFRREAAMLFSFPYRDLDTAQMLHKYYAVLTDRQILSRCSGTMSSSIADRNPQTKHSCQAFATLPELKKMMRFHIFPG